VKSRSPNRWRGLAAAYATFVFAASVAPLAAPAPAGLYFDKAAHLVVYVILAWLLLRAWRTSGRQSGDGLTVWVVATAYGAMIELVQSMLPWRSAEAADLLVNAAGAGLGVWAGFRLTESR